MRMMCAFVDGCYRARWCWVWGYFFIRTSAIRKLLSQSGGAVVQFCVKKLEEFAENAHFGA